VDSLPTILCLAALGWVPAGPLARVPAGQDELAERLAAVVAAARDELGLPGLAVGVALGGEPVLADGWGYVDAASEEAADAESPFRAGALTTPLVTLGVLMGVDEGAVALDDPLSKHLKDAELGELGALTVDQLLRHTTGVTPEGERAGADLLTWLAGQPLEHEPGHCAVHSGGNTYLLGRVLEATSGLSVQDFVRRRIAAPLGLEATGYREAGRPLREGAESAQELAGELVADPLLAHLFDAPELCTSTRDLLTLLGALAARELLSDAALERLRHPAPVPDGTAVTYVGGFSRYPLDEHEGLSLGGSLVGGAVHAAWYPGLDLTVVVLASAEDAPLALIERRLTRTFLGEPGPELVDLTLPAETLARYAGGYYVGCLSYLVEARAGHLWLTPPTGRSQRLLFQGGHAFAAEEDPELRVSFDLLDELARSLTLDDHGFLTVATRMDRRLAASANGAGHRAGDRPRSGGR